MATLREWVNRLWGMLGPGRKDRELEEELRLHLELAADDERRRGHSPGGAERAVRIRAGSVVQAMEALREQRGLPWFEDLARDVRYACRMLAKNPAFTVVSILSLAIGIGANCAVFSWADALLLRPLQVPRPGEVVSLGSFSPTTRGVAPLTSYLDYVDVRNRSTAFKGLVAFTGARMAFATEAADMPTLTIGMLASGNFFSAMGVEPQLGRAFHPDEDEVPGRDAVVILGHDFWERQFGGDRAILGRTVRLNGIEFTVIGVTPPQFTGLDQYARYDFFVPLMMWPRLVTNPNIQPLETRDFRSLSIKGRLMSGVTLLQAQTELSVIAKDLERLHPDTNRNQGITVRTELQSRITDAPPNAALIAVLTVLAGAVLFVACANVAGLLTSRAPVRAREIALRLAIGAGRPRVIRQLITESMLIAVIGCVLGIGLGYAGVMVFRQIQPPTDLTVGLWFELDRRALLFSLIVALTSAVLFGLAPAIQATRTDLTAVMKATDVAGTSRRLGWGRAWLVTGQVAISVVLLVIATRLYRGAHELLGSGPGYRTDHLLTMSFDTSLVRYSEAQTLQFFEQVAERARHVPGVRSAAWASSMPLDGRSLVKIVPEGFQFPAGNESATSSSATVGEDYFDTLGLSILKGRGFLATDNGDTPKVAVVNEQLARHYWPDRDPVGKRFRLNDSRGPLVEIVGLAKNSKYFFILEPPTDFVYFAYRQRPQRAMVLLAESLGDPSSLATPLREVVWSVDASQPVYNVRTMEEFYRFRVITIFNVIIGLVAAMGMMGLGLSIVGLYGLVAYAARRRTREIGIRMAIGADRRTVLRMVLKQGIVPAIVGLAIGLVVSAGVRRLLVAAFPDGPARTDYMAFPLVAATVLAVTLLAAYIPARRASRVNPTDALRHE